MHYYVLLIFMGFGLLISSFFLPETAMANELPRYASLSSGEVFLRAGPGKKYPVKWIYQRKGYPVEIVREYDNWRKIRDPEGYSGWVYKGLLSGKRMALITFPATKHRYLYRKADSSSQKIAVIENGAQIALEGCPGNWCEINSQGIRGWIERKYLWGIYAHEIIN